MFFLGQCKPLTTQLLYLRSIVCWICVTWRLISQLGKFKTLSQVQPGTSTWKLPLLSVLGTCTFLQPAPPRINVVLPLSLLPKEFPLINMAYHSVSWEAVLKPLEPIGSSVYWWRYMYFRNTFKSFPSPPLINMSAANVHNHPDPHGFLYLWFSLLNIWLVCHFTHCY